MDNEKITDIVREMIALEGQTPEMRIVLLVYAKRLALAYKRELEEHRALLETQRAMVGGVCGRLREMGGAEGGVQ